MSGFDAPIVSTVEHSAPDPTSTQLFVGELWLMFILHIDSLSFRTSPHIFLDGISCYCLVFTDVL